MQPPNQQCPLCLSTKATLFHTSRQKNLERDYFHCDTCDLVFVPPSSTSTSTPRVTGTSPTTTTQTTPTTAASSPDSGTSFAHACQKERAASTTAPAPAQHSPP